MINELPKKSVWSVGGIGNNQLIMNAASIVFGGGVRVGLEDNIWHDSDRTVLATNMSLLVRIHDIANSMGREIMKPNEARSLLQL
jgi:3-keto-5-aminohexanoate cleavage enzyme